ncbi:hypothetical protein SAY87_008412 [Trapa incisa]|uniref:Uncharacterized protein n=1 Tax=Trapa incisa TaxID=236973 RepID=A0AAN7KH51_9MYRT|nr:hypothetical protein SAY87_008412 [Trapa incisa]
MLQLFFAVAFSAVPLTLYLPPIRSLNLFVVTLEEFLRQTALGAYPRVRHACVRLFNSLVRLARKIIVESHEDFNPLNILVCSLGKVGVVPEGRNISLPTKKILVFHLKTQSRWLHEDLGNVWMGVL